MTAPVRRRRARGPRATPTLALLGALGIAIPGCGPSASRGGGAVPGAVIATIALPAPGTGIAIAPDGSRAWIPSTARIQVVDLRARQAVGAIETGDQPYAIAASADGRLGVAVDLIQRESWVLDLAGGAVQRHVAFGRPIDPVLRPGVALAPDGSRAFVTTSVREGNGADLLHAIDTTTGTATDRALDFHPGALAAAPDGRTLWVTGCRGLCADGALWAIDPAVPRALASVPLASIPGGLALSPDGARAWVANGEAASVSVIDLADRRVVATVPVGSQPLGVAASPDGSRVYVSGFADGTLTAIDTASLTPIASTRIGPAPRAIAISPDGRLAYVTSSEPHLSVVDLGRLGTPAGAVPGR